MTDFHIRPYLPEDLHPVHRLLAAATKLDRTPHITHAELRAIVYPLRSTAVAVLAAGTPGAINDGVVGFSRWSSTELPTMSLDGWVHPLYRQQGIGTALLKTALAPNGAKLLGAEELTARVYADIPGAVSLLESVGFVEERRFYAMWRNLDDSLLDPPPAPPGISVRPYRPETDGYAVYEADSEAFSTAWRSRPQSFEVWQARMANHDDLSLWVVAWLDNQIVGVCISRKSDYGEFPNDGWIGHLGVRSAYQGRGIGRFLLQEAFSRLRRSGFDRAGLHVDSLNRAALSLYESQGMTRQRERLHLVRNLNDIG